MWFIWSFKFSLCVMDMVIWSFVLKKVAIVNDIFGSSLCDRCQNPLLLADIIQTQGEQQIHKSLVWSKANNEGVPLILSTHHACDSTHSLIYGSILALLPLCLCSLCLSTSDAALLNGSARPCLTSLPPSSSLKATSPSASPFFLGICICIGFFFSPAAHVLTMCSSSLLPGLSLLPLFSLIHFLSCILTWCLSLLQDDHPSPPYTHTGSNSVSRFVCAGRTHGLAMAALMYIWAAVLIGRGSQTLWCSEGCIRLSDAQSKTVTMQPCMDYIHLCTLQTHRCNIKL